MSKKLKKLLELPEKKQRYVKARAEGKSQRAAAIEAGYAPTTALKAATHIETPDVKAAFAEIVRSHVPAKKIAARISEGLDAMETKFFQKDGTVTAERDVIAWTERRQYAELAAQMGDYWTPRQDMRHVGVFMVAAPGTEVLEQVFGRSMPEDD